MGEAKKPAPVHQVNISQTLPEIGVHQHESKRIIIGFLILLEEVGAIAPTPHAPHALRYK
jgi:hypothetical protein